MTPTIIGAWRVASPEEETAKLYGDHVFYFSRHGELIQTDLTATGPRRSLLTWTTRDGLLVIDQPSSPREDRVAWALTADGALEIAGSRYRPEPPTGAADPDAIWWALVAAGLWHGLASAGPEPFVPFVMLDAGEARHLHRIVAADPRESAAAAQDLLQHHEHDGAVSIRDGFIKRDGAKIDAVLATRYARDATPASHHAIPYRLGPRGGVATGSVVTLAFPRG